MSSLFILGNNFQSSTNLSSKDTLDKYYNSNLKDINKKTFNTLDNPIKGGSSFYSGNIKSLEYQVDSSKYARKSIK